MHLSDLVHAEVPRRAAIVEEWRVLVRVEVDLEKIPEEEC